MSKFKKGDLLVYVARGKCYYKHKVGYIAVVLETLEIRDSSIGKARWYLACPPNQPWDGCSGVIDEVWDKIGHIDSFDEGEELTPLPPDS